MVKTTKTLISAWDFIPKKHSLPILQKAAKHCEGCHLYKFATQTVFGEGNSSARLMIVGEIPGQQEDLVGKPFQGPAGNLLRETIQEIGMDEEDIYFTNVVKHFKFVRVNNRNQHRSPVAREITACKPWLETQIETIQPQLILCLGAVAAKTLISQRFKITTQRGKLIKLNDEMHAIATYHPSAILRAPDHDARLKMRNLFRKDIQKVADILY